METVFSILSIVLALAGFGVIHSLTAGFQVKARLKTILDESFVEGFYRLAYNLFSVITLLPALMLAILMPDQTLYRVPVPWSLVLVAVQATGLLGLVAAALHFDLLRFAGFRQVAAYLTGKALPLPLEPLNLAGLYAISRHPLYLFSLLVLWASPFLTTNSLAINIGATLYFMIGSLVEERRLISVYGDTYREYQKRVSWLLPLPRFGRSKS